METQDKVFSQKELFEKLIKLQENYKILMEDHNRIIEALNLDMTKFGISAFTPSVRFIVSHLLGSA